MVAHRSCRLLHRRQRATLVQMCIHGRKVAIYILWALFPCIIMCRNHGWWWLWHTMKGSRRHDTFRPLQLM